MSGYKVTGPYPAQKNGRAVLRVTVSGPDFVESPAFKVEAEAKTFAAEARRRIREASR